VAKKIIIYSTPNCGYCIVAKDFFRANKLAFKEIDVSEDEKAAQYMIHKSGQMGVPVVEIDGKMIIGFDKPAIKRALGIK